jgi:hypothetical protein
MIRIIRRTGRGQCAVAGDTGRNDETVIKLSALLLSSLCHDCDFYHEDEQKGKARR